MKKFLSLMLVLMMLMSLSSVSSYASDDDSDDDSTVEMSSNESDDEDSIDNENDSPGENKKKTRGRATLSDFSFHGTKTVSGSTLSDEKEILKEKREMMKEAINANHTEAKANRETFRNEHSDEMDDVKSTLSDEQKEALKKLHETHKTQMEALRAKLKDASTQEAREAIYTEMKALAETHYTEISELLGENASSLVEKRKAVWEENEMLRDENRSMRNEYKEVKRTTVEKYRKAFVNKLGSSLEKIPAEKLPQIVERINTMMEKEGTSETMMAALTAILELVEEKMEGDDIEADVLDTVESLLQ